MSDTLERLAIEERRDYFRKWRAQNKDKVKKHNATYWKRKAEKKLNAASRERMGV